MFNRLLINIVNSFNHTKCVYLSTQQCKTQLTSINLHPYKYSQRLRYYPIAVNSDRCVGSCNILMTYLRKYAFQNKQKI